MITNSTRVFLDNLYGAAYDRISADWDQWIRNNQGDLPSGYSGVPRLVYGRKDLKKIRSMRITLDIYPGSEGNIVGKHEVKDLPDAGLQPGKPFMSINRSKYHDPIATHAFAASATAATFNVQYKLALSGPPNYDTDNWSQPEEIESWVSGLAVRPVGSPRLVWSAGGGKVMSNTGEIDPSGLTEPRIALNPYDGEYEGPDYWKSSIKARNVFVCFSATGGDPDYNPALGYGWDTDGDGCIWVKYYDYTECTDPPDEDPEAIRDPGDLVPTIIFKQVDP